MAVQVGSRPAAGRARGLEKANAKARRQKITLGVCGVVLVVVLAIELPAMLSKASGGSSAAAPAGAPQPAAAAAVPAVAVPPSVSSALARIHVLPAKDPFVPQVGASPAASGSAAAQATGATTVTPQGPPVRNGDFVAKDPFVPQVATPAAATPLGGASPASVAFAPSLQQLAPAGSGYIVILSSAPSTHDETAAARAIVAAENAGLPDVRSSVLPTQTGKSLEVYTGPHPTQADAEQQLVRALRDGYTLASLQALRRTPPDE